MHFPAPTSGKAVHLRLAAQVQRRIKRNTEITLTEESMLSTFHLSRTCRLGSATVLAAPKVRYRTLHAFHGVAPVGGQNDMVVRDEE